MLINNFMQEVLEKHVKINIYETLEIILRKIYSCHTSEEKWNDIIEKTLSRLGIDSKKNFRSDIEKRGIKDLSGLDLIGLLNVWNAHSDKIYADYIKEDDLCVWIKHLKKIRNRWYHTTVKPYSNVQKLDDLRTLHKLLSYLKPDLQAINDIKNKIDEIASSSHSKAHIDRLFHYVQKEYLVCKYDNDCKKRNSGEKYPVGIREVHGIFCYNPAPEFLGRNYSGMVIVGLAPGRIRKESSKTDNEDIAQKIKQCIKEKFTENLMEELNLLSKRYIPGHLSASDLLDYKQWGDHFSLDKIAHINLCKCRGLPHENNPFESYKYCADKYFIKQMKEVLKPKFVLYYYNSTARMLESWGHNPGFGGDYYYIKMEINSEKPDRDHHLRIAEKINSVL